MQWALGILVSVICALSAAATTDELGRPFEGEWCTTLSILKLEQKGEVVTGTYGTGGQYSIKGTIKGNILTFELDEGQTKGNGQFEIDASGNTFTGRFQLRNGRTGIWNGWRPDFQAASDKLGDFKGLWLTDLGLMELNQTSSNVEGHYSLRGTSQIEGKVSGRRLDFRFKSLLGGKGWFDLATDGKSFTGASNTDRFPGWFGWHGRLALEFIRHVPLVAGKIVDGSTRSLLTYSVRAPEGYQASSSRKWPAVIILHGSNMNGRSYVNTIAIAWPEVGRDFILLGINGETAASTSDDPRFNYSYVNYVGRSMHKGFPGTDRESPALVSEAMTELKDIYPIDHYLVGGHSQGGFLTYSLLMNYPELIAGAFPASCGVINQCVPAAYDDPALKRAQRAVPLAIIHGKNDQVMGFSTAQYAAGLFGDAGWPAFRFFSDDKANHWFARLPIDAAIRWLETQASNNPVILLDFAASQVAQSQYRDAIAAVHRAKTLQLDDGQKRRVEQLSHMINAKAATGAAKYLPLIREAKDGSWIDDFLAFRADFEFAEAAGDVMAAFAKLRGQHEELAKKASTEALKLFQTGKQDAGYARYREIVENYYASSQYSQVKRSLEVRK